MGDTIYSFFFLNGNLITRMCLYCIAAFNVCVAELLSKVGRCLIKIVHVMPPRYFVPVGLDYKIILFRAHW